MAAHGSLGCAINGKTPHFAHCMTWMRKGFFSKSTSTLLCFLQTLLQLHIVSCSYTYCTTGFYLYRAVGRKWLIDWFLPMIRLHIFVCDHILSFLSHDPRNICTELQSVYTHKLSNFNLSIEKCNRQFLLVLLQWENKTHVLNLFSLSVHAHTHGPKLPVIFLGLKRNTSSERHWNSTQAGFSPAVF